MTVVAEPETYFAPAVRAAHPVLQSQVALFAQQPWLHLILDAMPLGVMILNCQRQLIFGNRPLLQMAGVPDLTPLLGKRPGEILDCIHAGAMPAGCGTSRFCTECGAARAILSAVAQKQSVEECRMLCQRAGQIEALDLQVQTTPYQIGSESFVVFAITDIRDQKYRQSLERIFFHDILNTTGVIGFGLELYHDSQGDQRQWAFDLTRSAVTRLTNEIQAQRELLAAENHELAVHPERIQNRPFLEQILKEYHSHPAAENRPLGLAPDCEDFAFSSDPALLGRVVANMIKNALEASDASSPVTAGCRLEGTEVVFWVHNPAGMPVPVQKQVFQRSFSTKGAGRGLGTYSMKLLSENYLRGKVDFTSTAETGTTFTARYPRLWDAP